MTSKFKRCHLGNGNLQINSFDIDVPTLLLFKPASPNAEKASAAKTSAHRYQETFEFRKLSNEKMHIKYIR